MFDQQIKELFVSKYSSVGDEAFFDFLLHYGNSRIDLFRQNAADISPDTELMQFYFIFLDLYRGEDNDIYLDMAKQFRRAAHYIHWDMNSIGLPTNKDGFLNLV
jgi:hypothetical protein